MVKNVEPWKQEQRLRQAKATIAGLRVQQRVLIKERDDALKDLDFAKAALISIAGSSIDARDSTGDGDSTQTGKEKAEEATGEATGDFMST